MHLGHPDQVIRNFAASLISILITIEKDWTELAKCLFNLLQESVQKFDENNVDGVLVTFKEILQIRNINSGEYNTEDIMQILYQLGSQITSLFPIPQVPFNIRLESIKCLILLIKSFAGLFKSNSEIDHTNYYI